MNRRAASVGGREVTKSPKDHSEELALYSQREREPGEGSR